MVHRAPVAMLAGGLYGFEGTTPQRGGASGMAMTPMTDLSPNAVMNMLDGGATGNKSRSKRQSPADLNAADMLFRGLSSPTTAVAESPRTSHVYLVYSCTYRASCSLYLFAGL